MPRSGMSVFFSVLLTSTLAMPAALAQGVNVNLGDAGKSNTATQTHVILEGGKPRVIQAGQAITDAELAALNQLLHTGHQNLVLSNAGTAVGGRLNVGVDLQNVIGNLSIPKGVTAVGDFANTSSISVLGSLTNAGNLFAYSSALGIKQATFGANQLTNLSTGVISSAMPQLAGITSVVKVLDLNLVVAHDLLNDGRIFSSGSLTIDSPNVTNHGTIEAAQGNVNFTAPGNTAIVVNNHGGSVIAAQGNINFRDASFTYKNDVSLLGGNWQAHAVNLFTGDGTATVDVDQINGLLNITAGIAHVTSTGPVLDLGNITLSGDPTFYNTGGDVVLNGSIITTGADIAIVAGGDIFSGTNSATLSTAVATGNAGGITLIAGAQFTSSAGANTSTLPPAAGDTTSTITITGGSIIGGRIDLTKGTPVTLIDTSSANGNSGAINLIAFGGTNTGSGVITLPTAGTLKADATNGNVGFITAIAGGTAAGNSIQLGTISSSPTASGNPGYVQIAVATPVLLSNFTILNGQVTGGLVLPGGTKTGSVATGPITAGGGTVQVLSGRNISIPSVNITPTLANAAGGTIIGISASSTALTVGATTANSIGSITSANAVGTGQGGELAFANSGNGGVVINNLTGQAPLTANAAGTGQGGQIYIDSTMGGATGSVTLNNPVVQAQGANGNGGTVIVSSTNAISNTSFLNANVSVASGTGNGGSVFYTTTGAAADINSTGVAQNNVGGNVTGNGGGSSGLISMTAGRDVNWTSNNAVQTLTTPGGDGATVQLTAGRNININSGLAANAGAGGNGNGGDVTLTADNKVTISGALQASGVGSGNGGNITATGVDVSNSSLTLATGGATGNGGTVTYDTNSGNAFNFSSSGTPANGVLGQISVTGQSAGTINILNKGAGGISVGAFLMNALPINGAGGTVNLDAVSNGGTGSVILGSNNSGGVTVNVSGTGANPGGSITVKGTSIIVPSTFSTLQADGGVTGNGGTVTVVSTDTSADLSITTLNGGLKLSAIGGVTSGNGGTLNVTAGRNLLLLAPPTAFNAQPGGSGNGANYSITGGRNVQISQSLFANALGTGNGGSISITSNSTDPFVLDNFPGTTLSQNYMRGVLFAHAAGNGNAGSISIVNLGTGGISHATNPANLAANPAGNGSGGSITLDAGFGVLTIGAGFNFNVSALGTGSTGGSLKFVGNPVFFQGASALTATGNTVGNGGSVTVHSSDPFTDLTVGAGALTINVPGGTVSGAGGTIDLSSGRNLFVNTASMAFAPTFGNGAKLFFAAPSGNVQISSGLSANAAVSGNGGTISITSNSGTAFSVNAATGNSIVGNISAQAVNSGSQGTIALINLGTGGITSTNVVINASGAGNSGTQTGSITLQGASLSSNFTMLVNGGTTGDGGTINLISTSPLFDISVNGGAMAPQATAAIGKGGTINITSARHIFVNAPSISVATGAGAGGTLNLNSNGNVQIAGSLLAVGQNGDGGSITVKSNSNLPFVLNAASANGITGFLDAHVIGAGNGGSVTVINTGGGGIQHQVSNAAINVSPGTSGKGGNITLDAAQSGGFGPLILGNSAAIMTLVANSTVGDGGNINISGTDILVGIQSINLNTSSTVGAGGNVTILTTNFNSDVKMGGAAGTSASINGVTGAGNLTVTAGRDILIAATGNFFGTTSGKGAILTLTAGTQTTGNVQIAGNLFINPTLNNGDGGQLKITFNDPSANVSIGTIGSGTCVGGVIIANGVGNGAPGLVSITNTAPNAPLNLQISPLGGVTTFTGNEYGSFNLTVNNGPVTINTAANITSAVNVSGSTSFTMSAVGGNALGFVVNDVTTSGGAITITNNSNSNSSITLQPDATINSQGGVIQLTTQNLDIETTITSVGGDIIIAPRFFTNNGIINAGGGTINCTPIGAMFLSGLGHWITTGKSITVHAAFNPFNLQGSQTYSDVGGAFVFLSGTTLSLSPGVSQSVITNTTFDVGYQDSNTPFLIQMASTSRFNGVGLTSASMFVYGNNGNQPISLKVADGSFATLSTSGGQIVVEAVGNNNNSLLLDSIAGTSPGTLITSGGNALLTAVNTVTLTNNIIVSADKPITVQAPNITHNGNLTTSATGNSIVLANATPNLGLKLNGTGSFTQTNATPGLTIFNSPNNLLTFTGASFTVVGAGAKLTINAPQVAVSNNTSLDVPSDITFALVGTSSLPLPVLQDLTLTSAGGNINFGTVVNANNLTVSTSGTGTIGGTAILSVPTALQANAGTGAINLKADAGTFSANSTGNVTFTESNTVIVQAITAQDVSLASAGAMTFSGPGLSVANLTINSNGLTTASTILATGSVSITNSGVFQNTNLGIINGDTGTISTTSFANNGNIGATGALTITATSPSSNTGNITGDALNIILPKLTNDGTLSGGTTTLSVSSNGSGLEIAGNGAMVAPISVNLTADTNSLVFSGNQNLTGVTNLNAYKFGQSVVVQAGKTVQGNTDVYVNTPTLILQGTLIGNPLHLNTVFGAGTIANDQGDVVLPTKLIFSGQNLAILASGNVVAPTGLASIKLSSTTGAGGSLTIVAGYNFTPGPTPPSPLLSFQTFTLGAPSASGGSVIMPKTSIDTSSTAVGKDGGNVTIMAHGGALNAGIINTGAITTSSLSHTGGNIRIGGGGGVQINGNVTSKGANAGSISISGTQPSIIGGPITIVNGLQIGSGAFKINSSTPGAGAAILVNGAIVATGSTGRGGDLSMISDAQIEVAKNIVTSGLQSTSPGITAGGNVNLLSSSFVSIGAGGINTSALTRTSASAAGDGGFVFILGRSGVAVNGNILTTGGTNKGTGDGGTGGDIILVTSNTNANLYYIDTIKITGFVDARGGAAVAGGNGGAGGDVTSNSGVLQVFGANKGISVNASAGTGGVPLAAGFVTLETFATQPIPASFDMLSTVKNVVALPGGMFTVGTAKPVNGTAGSIVSGASNASKANAARIVDTNDFISTNVFITVTGGSVNLNPTGTIAPDNGSGVRTLITPAQAVGVMQLSRGDTQTINLNASGQALTGSVMDFNINEVNTPFTAFRLQAADAPVSDIHMNISGARPIVTLPKAGAVIAGDLFFNSPNTVALVDFGAAPMKISAGGQIRTDNTGTLILGGSNGMWLNNGLIEAGDIAIARSGTATLVFTQGTGGTIQGALGAVSPAIILSPDLMTTYSVKFLANGAEFNLPVEFGNTHAVAAYKSLALANAQTFNKARIGSLTFGLTDSANNPITAVVQGSLTKALSMNIITLANKVGVVTTLTPLAIGDNSSLVVQSKMLINSVGGIDIGDNADLIAGVLKSTAPASGLFATTNIVKAGSITITNTGTSGITVGDNGSMVVTGGNLQMTSANSSITLGSNGLYQANGGRISILATGTVTGNTSNTFYSRATTSGVGSTGGGIEIGSGVTLKTAQLTAAFGKPKNTNPYAGALGAGVVPTNHGGVLIANLSGGGQVNLKTGATPSTVLLNKGAIVFDALGFGSGVQFDNSTFKVDGIKPVSAFNADDEEYVVDSADDDWMTETGVLTLR